MLLVIGCVLVCVLIVHCMSECVLERIKTYYRRLSTIPSVSYKRLQPHHTVGTEITTSNNK